MNILLLGGTRYFGIHLARKLLSDGHKLTIATRGQTPDPFGDQVQRIILERTDANSLQSTLAGKHYDVIYDNIAYGSQDVRALLDAVETDQYILTSSVSVYPQWQMDMPETACDPYTHPLRWVSREDVPYDEGKRQAEAAVFQAYPDQRAIAVRFPFVIGPDDYTQRLYFYVQHILSGAPISVDNPDAQLAFVQSVDAGASLAALAGVNYTGPLNICNPGTISPAEVAAAVQAKCGRSWVLCADGEPAPYNGAPSFSLDLARATQLLPPLAPLATWMPALLDAYIAQASA